MLEEGKGGVKYTDEELESVTGYRHTRVAKQSASEFAANLTVALEDVAEKNETFRLFLLESIEISDK